MWWHGSLLHSFFVAEYYSVIQICCILCFYYSIYGHVSSFHLRLLYIVLLWILMCKYFLEILFSIILG